MTKLTGKQRLAAENAILKRKLVEVEGQLASTYFFAGVGVDKATRASCMGSGILITMHYLGGKAVCEPFVLKDGPSDETRAALMADLSYSYDKAVEFKPKKGLGA